VCWWCVGLPAGTCVLTRVCGRARGISVCGLYTCSPQCASLLGCPAHCTLLLIICW
jgi:hypothetical protein